MNLKFKPIICLWTILFSINIAQAEFDFTGYIVDNPIVQKQTDEIRNLFNLKKTQFSNLTRIRLKPSIYFTDNFSLNAEYEADLIYLSSVGQFSLENNFSTSTQLFNMFWQPIKSENFNVNHYFDRFFIRQDFDWGNIKIGRQRVSWGTGKIWNPMDLFNPINPATFFKLEKDGADVLSTSIFIDDFSDIQLVYNPVDNFNNTNFAARFRSKISTYNFSIMSGYFRDNLIIGADFVGNFFTAGLRGEGIISYDQKKSNKKFVKLIIGMDYQFTPKLYGFFEYHFNGEGTNSKQDYLSRFAKLLSGEILNLNRNYISINLAYQLTALLNTSFTQNLNLNDKSGFVNCLFNYSVTEDVYLNVGVQLTYGSNLSEYWYYSDSYYLQSEYYF